ncbi:metal-dependent protein hydrolase [Tilletiaria anomala UBC 951]|uniref:Metal-dependent protein hydrolase n=1 Tax=Tilletiaria anomala (strain ATCC 24038 / CBS 436.72 / UBC 951) TaxID=1037660 RepID=A0A066WJ91_TILAU|nr:metal-dependent protein hydrolase [Tilletiaria anomala UBC 951]KDN52628.1 metal-dependent protein hydrolase [Tilletiaria anomala UBC 951]
MQLVLCAADEALAVSMLRRLPRFSQMPLTRTRDMSLIDRGTIVVDVGATYDATKNRFDHHQRGFEETFDADHKVKLSSAGLTWKHFGKDILRISAPALTPEEVETLYIKMYDDFVEGIDGIDNGVERYPAAAGKPAYKDRTDLSSRVSYLNPRWNEEVDDEERMRRFERASSLAGQEFFDRLDYAVHGWLPARKLVQTALANRKTAEGGDSSGKILIFDGYVSWKDHLFTLEKESNIPAEEQPLYAVYPDESGKWRVQAVPESPSSFASRKALPEPWRGIRDDDLSKLSGVPGCIFVHQSGFIGGNQTRAGALEMASKALHWS